MKEILSDGFVCFVENGREGYRHVRRFHHKVIQAREEGTWAVAVFHLNAGDDGVGCLQRRYEQ